MEVKAMTVLTDMPEVSWTDVALLVEELAEIYSTPTPKGWPEPKKVSNLYLIDLVSFTRSRGTYLYPAVMILMSYVHNLPNNNI